MADASRDDEARAAILQRLAAVRLPAVPRPAARERLANILDPVGSFCGELEAAGGEWLDLRGEGGLVAERLAALARAHDVWSSIEGIESVGAGRSAASPRDLASLEVAFIAGALGVAECGAVWHRPVSSRERAAALLAEHLVVVLPADRIVPRLFDAYAHIEDGTEGFGWFLCGPSKTADIEQALVLGAHGPCRMTLALI